jgi:hypothetical protein
MWREREGERASWTWHHCGLPHAEKRPIQSIASCLPGKHVAPTLPLHNTHSATPWKLWKQVEAPTTAGIILYNLVGGDTKKAPAQGTRICIESTLQSTTKGRLRACPPFPVSRRLGGGSPDCVWCKCSGPDMALWMEYSCLAMRENGQTGNSPLLKFEHQGRVGHPISLYLYLSKPRPSFLPFLLYDIPCPVSSLAGTELRRCSLTLHDSTVQNQG